MIDRDGPDCSRGRGEDVLLVGYQGGSPSSEEKSYEDLKHIDGDSSPQLAGALNLTCITLYSLETTTRHSRKTRTHTGFRQEYQTHRIVFSASSHRIYSVI